MTVLEPTAANLSPLQQKFQRVLQRNVEHESSLLCWAAGQGWVSLMKCLLDGYHADINKVHDGTTPLIEATNSGSLAAVKYILSWNELNITYFDQGDKALWDSIYHKDPAIAQQLLRQPGIDVNGLFRKQNGEIVAIFNEAVVHNNTEMVKALLADERTDPNIAAENLGTMRTPLLCASSQGYVEAVKLLLGDSRVDTAWQDRRGCSALHWAAQNGNAQMVGLLLDDGRIDVNAQTHRGSTALHLAAKAGHIGAVNRLLMTDTIDINAQNRKGRTALWYATRQGHDQVASRLLIEEDVEVNAIGTGETTERSTSLHHAVEERNLALVHQLLAKSTADPNMPDEDGRTPLWWAVDAGDQLLVISLLDDLRTQPHIRDNSGMAPVDIARSRNKYEIVCLLSDCRHYCPRGMFAEAVILVYFLAAAVRWAFARGHISEWR